MNSMSAEDNTGSPQEILIGLAMGAILGVLGGSGLSSVILQESWRGESVRHGYAEYAPSTGKWRWKQSQAPIRPFPIGQKVVVLHGKGGSPFFEGEILAYTADGKMARVTEGSRLFAWQPVELLIPVADHMKETQ